MDVSGVIMQVPPKKGGTNPFLCLTDPSSSSSVPDPQLNSTTVYGRADNPKRRAVGVANERTHSSAKNHGKSVAERSDRRLEKYFVFAVMDKEAVLLNKSEAEGAFVLTKTISEDAAEAGAASYAPPSAGDVTSKRERHAQLEENFGSRKRRKSQKKQSMAVISSDRVVNANKLESTLEKFLANDEEDDAEGGNTDSVSNNLKRLLPPFDEKAEVPENAYPSTGYFPPEDRASVQETISPESFVFESVFARSRFTRTKNPEQRKLAGYFECLFRFSTRLRGFVADADAAARLMAFGDAKLGASLLKRFMEAQPANLGGGWGKTRLLKDKLLINLLIVALALDGFRLAGSVVNAIASDLKLEISAVTPLLFKIGCKIVSDRGDEDKLYELKVPLKFVEDRRRGKRGGGGR
jgi:hypothetical protein